MIEPKKAMYSVEYKLITQCPWCGNDQSFKTAFLDSDIEVGIYDCDRCHRPFYLEREE